MTLNDEARLEDPYFWITDPWPVFQRMRREEPFLRVTTADGNQYRAVTRFRDIRAVSERPEQFISGRGVMYRDRIPPEGITAMNVSAPDGAQFLATTDQPRHRRARRIIAHSFTARRVERLETEIRTFVNELLDDVPVGEEFDVIDHMAAPLPFWVISSLLGLPREDWQTYRRWVDTLVNVQILHEPPRQELLELAMQVISQSWDFLLEQLQTREQDPRDDFMSAVAAAEVDGQRLRLEDRVVLAQEILAAGTETTTTLLAGGLEVLAEFKDQLKILREEPERIRPAVDEMLRWVTPITVFGRTAAEDTMIGEQRIKAGEYLLMIYASGNRDETVWDNADSFDVRRTVDPLHVAFGWGEHVCLGAGLARLEARIFFEEVLRRFSSIEQTGPKVRYPTAQLHRIDRLPITLGS